MLAAIAGRTTRILLGSAVTVLSTDDPVRVFQRFSTLNALSNGRAEVILGRGSFTESYPLFGYDLSRYEELFEDKLRAVRRAAQARAGDVERDHARRRSPARRCTRRSRRARCATWVGVGGSPESVVRAARYGLPLTLAIIGGSPQRFRPYVDLYLQSLEKLGQPVQPIAVHSPGHVAATDEQAKRELWPHYEVMINRIGGERGWPPATRAQFEREAGPMARCASARPRPSPPRSPDTVATLGLSRFNIKYSAGTLPHDDADDEHRVDRNQGRAAGARAAGSLLTQRLHQVDAAGAVRRHQAGRERHHAKGDRRDRRAPSDPTA